MLRNLFLVLLFPAVVVSAFYINKYLLKTVRPKESFGRFLLYLLISLAIAFIFTWLGVFALLKILGFSKQ